MSRAEMLRMQGVETLVENESPAQAIPLLRKAADMGDAFAQFMIGSFYATGSGVPRDFTIAAHWLQLAAQQGDAEAQHGLGFLYATGQGVARDSAEAARWYSKAAEQGHADAQNDLGVLYAVGKGVEHDEVQAENLFIVAAAQGSFQAKANLVGIQATDEETDNDVADYLKAANDGDPDAHLFWRHFTRQVYMSPWMQPRPLGGIGELRSRAIHTRSTIWVNSIKPDAAWHRAMPKHSFGYT